MAQPLHPDTARPPGLGPRGSSFRPARPLPRGRTPQVGSDALERADSIWAGKGKWPSWSGRARGRSPLWSRGASPGLAPRGLPGGVQPVRDLGAGGRAASRGRKSPPGPVLMLEGKQDAISQTKLSEAFCEPPGFSHRIEGNECFF